MLEHLAYEHKPSPATVLAVADTSSIHDRIRQLRENKGWSMEQLADAVSAHENLPKPLAWQAVQQWENGSTAPKRNRMASVAAVLGVSLSQLMGDESLQDPDDFEMPMFSRGPASEPAPSYGLQPILSWQHEDELPPGEFVMVPRLGVHLSAGNGSGTNQVEIQFNEAQPQAFRADWVRQQHFKPKKLAAMTASGDSMEPTIHDGDSLLIDTGNAEVQDGKVYALWYEGGERVKRLYRLPGGGLRIKSDNPAFGPIELGPEYLGHVRVIGRVVHRSGTGGL